MATKKVATMAVKKKKLNPYYRVQKSLYVLLVTLCFCVVLWLGYETFNRVNQGYDAYTHKQETLLEKEQDDEKNVSKPAEQKPDKSGNN